MSKLNGMLERGQSDPIVQAFHEHRATLHIKYPDYAWIELGGFRLYFHDTKDRKHYTEKYTTLDGREVEKAVIPFDGWEGRLDNPKKDVA